MEMQHCHYCLYRTQSIFDVIAHERDEHRSERWARFFWRIVRGGLAGGIGALIGVPLLDYIVKFWTGRL